MPKQEDVQKLWEMLNRQGLQISYAEAWLMLVGAGSIETVLVR